MSRIIKKLILTIFASTYCFYKEVSLGGLFFFSPFGSAFPDFLKIYFLKAIILKPIQERNRKFPLHRAFPHPQVYRSILIIIAI